MQGFECVRKKKEKTTGGRTYHWILLYMYVHVYELIYNLTSDIQIGLDQNYHSICIVKHDYKKSSMHVMLQMMRNQCNE